MPPSENTDSRLARLEEQRAHDDRWRERTDKTLESVAETLRALARIETQNDAMARELDAVRTEQRELRDKLEAIDKRLPLLEQARAGVAKTVQYVLIAVGAALLALIGLKGH